MDRNELHQQILELADKIGHLNDTLSRSKRVHPVEIDLLRLYVREMVAGTEELAEIAGLAKVVYVPYSDKADAVTITEPVSLEELSAVQPTVEVAPVAPPETIAVKEPVVEKRPESLAEINVEPMVEKQPEPIVEAKVEPIIEKKADPVVEVKHEPIVEKKIEPELAKVIFTETSKEPEPIFQPVASIPEPEPEKPVEVAKEAPAPQPEPIEEESPEPPLRRQVAMQPDTSKQDFVKPIPGVAKPVLHTIEEEFDAPSINDKFSQQSDLFQNTRRADGKGLKEMMDLGERFLFMKELFGGDAVAFDRITAAIDGVASVDQAHAYIEGVLRQKFDWEGKEPIVRQFSNLVEQRFKD